MIAYGRERVLTMKAKRDNQSPWTAYRQGEADYFASIRARAVYAQPEPAHVHDFGPFEHSRFTGTLRRECKVPGCKVVSLDSDDEA